MQEHGIGVARISELVETAVGGKAIHRVDHAKALIEIEYLTGLPERLPL
jgi:Cu/Ag efflux pump CusA